MSLSRNMALEAEVSRLSSEVEDVAEFWAGTMWGKMLIKLHDELIEKINAHNYNVYPLVGKLKKTLALARSEMEAQ